MFKLLPIILVLVACGGKKSSDDGAGAPPTAPAAKSENAGAATPPPAKPTPPPSSVPASKDFTVLDSKGAGHTISSLVTGSYLVVTLTESSWLCFGCRALAEAIDASTTIQGYLKGPKCTYLSLLQKDDYSDWLEAFPADEAVSFVGARSYSTDKAFADIASLYGATYDDTQFTFIIDKNGNLVVQGLSSDPSEIADRCM